MNARQARRRHARDQAQLDDEIRAQLRWQFRLQLAVVAAVVIGVATAATIHVIGGRGADPATSPFAGIAQHATTLGSPAAPLTVTEIIDPQCPFCAQASRTIMPMLVERYVRTGRVRLQLNFMAFLGPDSRRAARGAYAAARQNRLYEFMDSFFAHQGREGSGYVTSDFLRDRYVQARMDPVRAARDAVSRQAARWLTEQEAAARRLGTRGTPSFFAEARGSGSPREIPLPRLDARLMAAAIDRLLARVK